MNPQPTSTNIYDTVIRLLLILLITGWCFLIIQPFSSIILWSLILGIALHPLHEKLSAALRGRPKLASVILVVSFFVIIIIPCWLLIDSAVGEAKHLKAIYDNQMLVVPPAPENVKDWPLIGDKLYSYWQAATENLEDFLTKHQEDLLALGGRLMKIIIDGTGGIIQLILAVAIAGVILCMGQTRGFVTNFFRKVGGSKGDTLASVSYKVIGNVVKGILGTAFIVALLHGIVFMLAGVPYSGIWTIAIFVLGIVQVPSLLITGPMIVYLFVEKETGPAIAWSVTLLVVGLSDNVLKPILLGKGAPVPMVIIFIGAIGGVLLSGIIGLFTGAVVMALGYTLFNAWIHDGYVDQTEATHEIESVSGENS